MSKLHSNQTVTCACRYAGSVCPDVVFKDGFCRPCYFTCQRTERGKVLDAN